MKNAIIFGANSDIACSLTHKLAASGYNLYLCGRNENLLELNARDLKNRYNIETSIKIIDFAMSNSQLHDSILPELCNSFAKNIDLIFIAHGFLPNQELCAENIDDELNNFQVNALSVITICNFFAKLMKKQGYGTIAAISSVAGLRGRQSNYSYGAAKGFLNIYLQGLRNSLFHSNVHVLTIMPGFVDTKMTKNFKKGALWASPDKVANDIYNAILKKKDVLFTPWFWKYIMKIICFIPEGIFKKLKM